MSKTKEAETQPYRNFKEFLDTIIKMPEDLKNRLANEFERRRLEVPVVKTPVVEAPVVEDKPDEEKSFFGNMFSKNSSEDPVVTEDNPVVTKDKPNEEKSFFADMFSKNSSENNPVVTEDKSNEDKSFFGDMFSKNSSENKPVVTENKDKSLFDSIFTNNQTNEMINKFSGTAPQKKCQIRPW
jgi:hypothetical protein